MSSTTTVEALQDRLRRHEIYPSIRGIRELRVFMEHHVVCVWDFMSLLKSLQRDIAGVAVPWTPSLHPDLARLINEIVLDEESDAITGGYGSHFELYLRAMDEIRADAGPMRRLVDRLRSGDAIERAIAGSGLRAACADYLAASLSLLAEPVHARAAMFHSGREEIIPAMFQSVVEGIEAAGTDCPSLRDYLERHIETDSERHGPLSQRLADTTCGGDPARIAEAREAAAAALRARTLLWDAAAKEIAGLALTSGRGDCAFAAPRIG